MTIDSVNQFNDVNILVAVGSVDGMAGAAAYMRHTNNTNIELIFTQAFQVNTIDVTKWAPHSKVGFIDLGVNTEGLSPNPQLTIDFVKKIYDLGHSILFIADEHGKEAWSNVLTTCGHQIEELVIQPENRNDYGSSCAILLKEFGSSADEHTKELLEAGHQGDLMNFDTKFGNIFNKGIKSNLADSTRRPYLARYMAQNTEADSKIVGWMNEYREMELNQSKILESGKDLGYGVYIYNCTGRHDATSIFNAAYKTSPIVVLSETPVFIEGKMQIGTSIATNRKDLNVLEIIQKAGVLAGGMASKANFALKDQQAAIDAIINEQKKVSFYKK